ncbi:carbohydrate sulfotransferase [Plakobranchus ocellatus]|uniref:Carbohydrate sulfotransferase n=1 Tax=Plakobranchus ocellatus TaxID=259542 RepID=A0AAV4AGD0_9GAST|nr:carbohydrate sulfotransferase [Plakobranchus ocellatus]
MTIKNIATVKKNNDVQSSCGCQALDQVHCRKQVMMSSRRILDQVHSRYDDNLDVGTICGLWKSSIDELSELDNVYQKRRENSRQQCNQLAPESFHRSMRAGAARGGNIFYDPNTNSMYCSVAKIGSSMWKRLFLVLHSNKTRDPFSLSGLAIHTNQEMAQLSLSKLPKKKRLQVIDDAFTFMFARNPFHRIFSAYCDKIFMLAYETKKIVRDVRRKLRQANRYSSSTDEFIYTGPEYNVTFAETLDYAARSNDTHFMTISSQCNPCDIEFQVLGKLESLDLDSRYILAKLNRSHILRNKPHEEKFKQSRDQGIIKELVERVFRVLNAEPKATSKYKALVRMWKVFHIRGLVRDDLQFPLNESESESLTAFRMIYLGMQALKDSGRPEVRLAQREKYYAQAFRSVPLAVMERFSKYVDTDCKLFDYDCSPSDIFQGRQHGDEEDNIFSNDQFLYTRTR